MLAIAARTLLMTKTSRVRSFQVIKEFLIQMAIDKDRIVEILFEHLMLFCMDDADCEDLNFNSNPIAPEFPPSVQEVLTKCKTFLLQYLFKNPSTAVVKPALSTSIGRIYSSQITPASTSINMGRIQLDFYRVLRLEMKLKKMLGENEEAFNVVKKVLSPEVLTALINTSHFVHLEVPDFIITKDLHEYVTLQKMIW